MNAPGAVTLITGTRKGIGRHLAEHYCRLGHRVIGVSREPAPWACEGYRHYAVSVTNEDAIKSVFAEIKTRFGRLDNLINNAGIASMNHSMTTPLSAVERVFATNVFGAFLLAREAAKLMCRYNKGRIVNVSTVAVPLKVAGEAAYAASKAAVENLTSVLAKEFAPWGITVNCVGPTPVDTDLIRNVPADKLDALLAQQAIPRRGTVADVCNVVDFFLREESEFVTGQKIYLGGVS